MQAVLMSSTAVMTLVEGLTAVDQLRFATATALDGTYRIAHTSADTTLTAVDEISFTALTVNLPSAVFTAEGATISKVSVAGTTSFSNVTATDIIADTLTTNLFEAKDPATDTITVTASKIQLNADVEVTGTLDTASTRELLIKDKILTLGAHDANNDGVEDVDDTTRDGAGILIPGAPANLPVGADAGLYEHSLKWIRNDGDFNSDGTAVVPHRKPSWEFKGGAVGLAAPDTSNRKAHFFFAPYYTSTIASLGLYYSVDGQSKLIQTFAAPAVPV